MIPDKDQMSIVERQTFLDTKNKFVVRYLVKHGELTYESALFLKQKSWEKLSPEEGDELVLDKVCKTLEEKRGKT